MTTVVLLGGRQTVVKLKNSARTNLFARTNLSERELGGLTKPRQNKLWMQKLNRNMCCRAG